MKKRIQRASYIVAIIFIIFTFKLWHLQIIKGGEHQSSSRNNRLRITKMPSPRGIIYDTNNLPIVKNILSFDISIEVQGLKDQSPQYLSRLCELLSIDEEELKEKLNKKTYSETFKIKEDIPWTELAMIEARKIDF